MKPATKVSEAMYQIMQPVNRSVVVILQPLANGCVAHSDLLGCCFGIFVHRTRALSKLCSIVPAVMSKQRTSFSLIGHVRNRKRVLGRGGRG